MAIPFRYVVTGRVANNPLLLSTVLLVDIPSTLWAAYADAAAVPLWSTPTPTAGQIQDIVDGKIAQRTLVLDMRSSPPDHSIDVLLDRRWQDFKTRVEAASVARVGGDFYDGAVWTGAIGPTPPPPPPDPSALDVGVYYLPTTAFTTAASRGVTLAHEWAFGDGRQVSYLDAAQAAGLKVWLELAWKVAGGCQNHTDLTNWMTPYLSHPALEGWMFVDEPDLRNLNAAETIAAYNHMKTVDAVRPIHAVITFEKELGNTGVPAFGEPYIPACDTIVTDKYPIPYGTADFVRGPIQKAVLLGGARPIGAVIQVFDWNGAFGPSRPPTTTEVREMGLAALNEGATARLWLYTYGDLITDCADTWAVLGSVITDWRAV